MMKKDLIFIFCLFCINLRLSYCTLSNATFEISENAQLLNETELVVEAVSAVSAVSAALDSIVNTTVDQSNSTATNDTSGVPEDVADSIFKDVTVTSTSSGYYIMDMADKNGNRVYKWIESRENLTIYTDDIGLYSYAALGFDTSFVGLTSAVSFFSLVMEKVADLGLNAGILRFSFVEIDSSKSNPILQLSSSHYIDVTVGQFSQSIVVDLKPLLSYVPYVSANSGLKNLKILIQALTPESGSFINNWYLSVRYDMSVAYIPPYQQGGYVYNAVVSNKTISTTSISNVGRSLMLNGDTGMWLNSCPFNVGGDCFVKVGARNGTQTAIGYFSFNAVLASNLSFLERVFMILEIESIEILSNSPTIFVRLVEPFDMEKGITTKEEVKPVLDSTGAERTTAFNLTASNVIVGDISSVFLGLTDEISLSDIIIELSISEENSGIVTLLKEAHLRYLWKPKLLEATENLKSQNLMWMTGGSFHLANNTWVHQAPQVSNVGNGTYGFIQFSASFISKSSISNATLSITKYQDFNTQLSPKFTVEAVEDFNFNIGLHNSTEIKTLPGSQPIEFTTSFGETTMEVDIYEWLKKLADADEKFSLGKFTLLLRASSENTGLLFSQAFLRITWDSKSSLESGMIAGTKRLTSVNFEKQACVNTKASPIYHLNATPCLAIEGFVHTQTGLFSFNLVKVTNLSNIKSVKAHFKPQNVKKNVIIKFSLAYDFDFKTGVTAPYKIRPLNEVFVTFGAKPSDNDKDTSADLTSLFDGSKLRSVASLSQVVLIVNTYTQNSVTHICCLRLDIQWIDTDGMWSNVSIIKE